jgi:hypothetical protein
MPVLYGEGLKKAFRRLQEEIMRTSSNQTILALKAAKGNGRYSSGLLAESPAEFGSFADTPILLSSGPANLAPFSMTNLGLSIRITITEIRPGDPTRFPLHAKEKDGIYMGVIRCTTLHDNPHSTLVLYLKRVEGARFFANGQPCRAYRRVWYGTWTTVSSASLWSPEMFSMSRTNNEIEILVLEDEHFFSVGRLT